MNAVLSDYTYVVFFSLCFLKHYRFSVLKYFKIENGQSKITQWVKATCCQGRYKVGENSCKLLSDFCWHVCIHSHTNKCN